MTMKIDFEAAPEEAIQAWKPLASRFIDEIPDIDNDDPVRTLLDYHLGVLDYLHSLSGACNCPEHQLVREYLRYDWKAITAPDK